MGRAQPMTELRSTKSGHHCSRCEGSEGPATTQSASPLPGDVPGGDDLNLKVKHSKFMSFPAFLPHDNFFIAMGFLVSCTMSRACLTESEISIPRLSLIKTPDNTISFSFTWLVRLRSFTFSLIFKTFATPSIPST